MQVMQVLKDTQVQGRFFPQGTQVQAINAGDCYLVLPNLDAHTTVCMLPASHLSPVVLFRAVLMDRRFGLLAEQEYWALDEDDLRIHLSRQAPDCEIIELDEVLP